MTHVLVVIGLMMMASGKMEETRHEIVFPSPEQCNLYKNRQDMTPAPRPFLAVFYYCESRD